VDLYISGHELHVKPAAEGRRARHHPRGEYGFDRFYDWFFAGGARRFGNGCGDSAT